MNSCFECLYPSCGGPVEVFINYSRFHGFCNLHYPEGALPSLISCLFCKCSLKIYPDLHLKRKEDFYSQLSECTPKPLIQPNSEPKISGQFAKPPLNTSSESYKTNKAQTMNARLASKKVAEKKQISNPEEETKKNLKIRDESPAPLKCDAHNCSSKKAKKLCNNHAFCENHTKRLNDYLHCPLCRCPKCKQYGMYYFPKCQQKYCPNAVCKDIIKCCFDCCQKGQNEMKACKHFLCESHYKKGFDCLCKKCVYCYNKPVKIRGCLHLVCDNCEYEGDCRKCLEGLCALCGQNGPVKARNCEHKLCESCKDEACSLCQPICYRCLKNKSSLLTSCKAHPKCEECEGLFSGLNCVYCGELTEFTCSKCNSIVPILNKYVCRHKFCNICNEKLDCNHTTMCKSCVVDYGFCSECHPNWICAKCNKIEKHDDFTCLDNLCKDCGIDINCGHFKCTRCKHEEFMHEGQCLSCAGSICDFCAEITVVTPLQCRHKACSKCENKYKLCVLCYPLRECLFCERELQIDFKCNEHPYCSDCAKVTSIDACIVCNKNLQEFQCSFCLRLSAKLNPIKCGHSACNVCLIMNLDTCEICKDDKCSFCLSEEKLVTSICKHPLCENCQGIIKNEPCPKCTRTEQNFLCQGCKSFINLLQLQGCQHKICLACNNNSSEICIICSNKCSYCKKSKENLIINLDCEHYFCIDCFNGFIQKHHSCIFCVNMQLDYTCNNCKRVLNDLYKQQCGHNLCSGCCSQKCVDCIEGVCNTCGENKILKANECKHLLCDKCLDEKYCRVCDKSKYCKVCNYFVLNDIEMCQHQICELCRNKLLCVECLCQACQKNNFIHKFNCDHRICGICAGEGNCPMCILNCCELCNKKKKLYDKGCGHYLCEECQSLNKCYVCDPGKFCISCKEDKIKNCLCDHRICNSCRNKHKCLECKCSNCKKDNKLEKKLCGHLMCYNCTAQFKKCPCNKDQCKICKCANVDKSINPCGHIVCKGCNTLKKCGICYPEWFCKVCKLYKIEVFCEHGACCLCRDKCLCDLVCQICKKKNQKLSQMNCGHQVCLKCSKSEICTNCYKSKCDFCGKDSNMKTRHDCTRHMLCKDCFDIQICYACNPHYYCPGCYTFEITPHCIHKFCNSCIIQRKCDCYCKKCYGSKIQNLLQCGHYSCACPNSTCLECKQSACIVCKATGSPKIYCPTCKLYICDACLIAYNCPNSKCKECSEVHQSLCPHKLCTSCVSISKCPCFCTTCNKSGILIRTCLYQHSFCFNCSRNSDCPICYDDSFEILSIPNNEPMQDLLLKGENSLRIPILPDLVPSVCIKCNYMGTTDPSRKCMICQNCCNSEKSIVKEVELGLEYQCCMKTYCKHCSYMISNSLGKRRYHLCKVD